MSIRILLFSKHNTSNTILLLLLTLITYHVIKTALINASIPDALIKNKIVSLQCLSLDVVIHQSLKNSDLVKKFIAVFAFKKSSEAIDISLTDFNETGRCPPLLWRLINANIPEKNIHSYRFITAFNALAVHQKTLASDWFMHALCDYLCSYFDYYKCNALPMPVWAVYAKQNSACSQQLYVSLLSWLEGSVEIRDFFKKSSTALFMKQTIEKFFPTSNVMPNNVLRLKRDTQAQVDCIKCSSTLKQLLCLKNTSLRQYIIAILYSYVM